MKTIKVDVVDFWGGFDKTTWWVINLLRKHYNVEFSDKPDFLFYSLFSNDFEKYDNCVKIFYTGENALPNFNKCDYATTFHNLDFGDRFFKRYCTPVSAKINDRSGVTDDMVNRRFCNFIYSNAALGSQAKMRQDFCKKLMEYKHVDCPGIVLHNMDTDELEPRNGDWIKSKIEFLKKYKFTLAFENSVANGYITEKMYHPLQALSVPIYCGDPEVVKEVNPRSFINVKDYDNFDDVIERIKYLDTHDDEYLAMLREQPMQPDYDFQRESKFVQWLCDIVERGNIPFDKGTRPDWDVVAYKNQISRLTNENARLKSYAENTPYHNLEKQIDDVKNQQNDLARQLIAVKQQIDTVISEAQQQTTKELKQIQNIFLVKIQKKHAKHRKYFNVLLVSQILLFIILLLLMLF